MDYLNTLNDKQREAAIHVNGPLLILAGAGSGKTATMTRRIAFLVSEIKVNPYNILAVTFTNKAAREMRERVSSLIGEYSNMWILTFHSACLRILRKNAEQIGYTSDFTVYDPSDQKAVIKNVIKNLGINDKKFTPQYLLGIISDSKEKSIKALDYNKENGSAFPHSIIGDAYRAYENILKRNNAMDFDDLICKAVDLLDNNKEVLDYYQERFKYIMVDEYQDTNYMQYRLVRLLSMKHNNICVVGDDDQCIYQWRGADIRNIIEFERDFKDVKVIKLEQNYRSCGNILDAAHSIITCNKGRKEKKLWTERDPGEKITYFRAQNDKEEAIYITGEIDRLKTNSRRYSDFAVLYRTNAQSRRFEEAMMSAGIPYRVLGGTKYYDRKEIKDMLSYMRLVVNPDDNLSLARIINEPKRGIGAKTIEKLMAMSDLRGEGILRMLSDKDILTSLSVKASQGARQIADTISEFHENKDKIKVSDIYDGLLVKTGYIGALEEIKTIESESRIENLLEFKSVIYDYEAEDPNITLSDFLERVALVADVDNHDEQENAVALMTLHSAKGLEFPVVFIPGMEDGLFPGWRSLDSNESLEEERRLCYVGITRAKEKLYLTSAETRTMYGRTEYTRESQFMRELDKSLLDEESSRFGNSVINSGDQNSEKYGSSDSSKKYGKANNPFLALKYIKKNQEVKNISDRLSSRSTSDVRSRMKADEERHRTESNDISDIRGSSGQKEKIEFNDGDKVIHDTYGEGMVISSDGGKATIVFETVGIKKLNLSVANLKKK